MEHTIIAVVTVMDSRGKPFNVNQLDHMMLLPHPYTPHITVRLAEVVVIVTIDRHEYRRLLPHPNTELANKTAAFEVYGVVVGTTQLSFNATSRNDHVISSRSCDLEVYSDIKLIPPVMILLPGGIGQVSINKSN